MKKGAHNVLSEPSLFCRRNERKRSLRKGAKNMTRVKKQRILARWSVQLSLILLVCQGVSPLAVADALAETDVKSVVSETTEPKGLPIDDAHFGETLKWWLDRYSDENKDGFLSEKENQNMTSINIDAYMGSEQEYEVDLRGFEYLPNISSIILGRSDGFGGIPVIKNMDTTSLNLKGLKFYYPKFINSTIDLANSTEGKEFKLDSPYANLTSVNLPAEAPNLKYLNVNGVPLKTLDVSGYPNLETLYARYGTEFNKLDVSNNPKLKILMISSPNLTDLNVSNLTELSELHLQDSPIESLDVLNNKKIKSLLILNTQISSLDVSSLNQLTLLWVMDNHLATLDLPNQPNLNDLGLNNNISAPNFNGVPNESIEGMIQQDPQTHVWQVNFNQWIPVDLFSRVSMKEYTQEDWSYDAKTGIATYLKSEKPGFIDYKYETNSVKVDNWSKNTAMYVRATLTQGFTIQAQAEQGGTITPMGDRPYVEGSTPTYTVTPGKGYRIEQVFVDGKEVALTENGTYTFDPLEKDHQIKASFQLLPVVTATTTKGGTITPTGALPYTEGSIPTYTVVPDEGYAIEQVLVDGKEVALTESNTYTFAPIEKDHQIEASFRLLPVITSTATTGGTVTPLGPTSYAFGDKAMYTVEPAEGYRIKMVKVDGKKVQLVESSYTFRDVQTSHELAVTFEEKPKVGGIISPTQLTRSLSEIETYLAKNPTETLSSYVLKEVKAKGYYTFEGETKQYDVPVVLTSLSRSEQALEAGTYQGILSLDSAVWSGKPVTQPIEFIVTEKTEPVEPLEPVQPLDPSVPGESDKPVYPEDPTHSLDQSPPPESGEPKQPKRFPQTGEQISHVGGIGLLLLVLTGSFLVYWREKNVLKK